MENKTIQQKLMNIQQNPIWIRKEASGYNYKYYKKEQIITELKPLLKEQGLGYSYKTNILSNIIDNSIIILNIHINIYDNKGDTIEFSDVMVINLNKKGMDAGQIKGASDTYFWKYALANIFMIPTSDKDLDDIHNKIKEKQELKKDEENLPNRLKKATENNDLATIKEKLKTLAKNDEQAAFEIKALLKQYNNKFKDIPKDELDLLISSYE